MFPGVFREVVVPERLIMNYSKNVAKLPFRRIWRSASRTSLMRRVSLCSKVCTDPNLVSQWWGPRGLVTTVDKMDMRPGGVWRFVQRGPDGSEYAFHGVYREIMPQKRIVDTFEFEGMPGHVIIETMMFEDHDGKTRLVGTSLFQTVEDRDGMLR